MGAWFVMVLLRLSADLDHLEVFLTHTTVRAYPVVRHVFPHRSGLNTVFRPTFRFVINQTTHDTLPLLHRTSSLTINWPHNIVGQYGNQVKIDKYAQHATGTQFQTVAMIPATPGLTNARMDTINAGFVPIAVITDTSIGLRPSLQVARFGIIAGFYDRTDRYDRYRRRNEPGHG